jgi:hypothetical protein
MAFFTCFNNQRAEDYISPPPQPKDINRGTDAFVWQGRPSPTTLCHMEAHPTQLNFGMDQGQASEQTFVSPNLPLRQ